MAARVTTTSTSSTSSDERKRLYGTSGFDLVTPQTKVETFIAAAKQRNALVGHSVTMLIEGVLDEQECKDVLREMPQYSRCFQESGNLIMLELNTKPRSRDIDVLHPNCSVLFPTIYSVLSIIKPYERSRIFVPRDYSHFDARGQGYYNWAAIEELQRSFRGSEINKDIFVTLRYNILTGPQTETMSDDGFVIDIYRAPS
jgi:hypothetical protein